MQAEKNWPAINGDNRAEKINFNLHYHRSYTHCFNNDFLSALFYRTIKYTCFLDTHEQPRNTAKEAEKQK